MGGHLFVIRGDVTRLTCDAWALPCDASLLVSEAWVRNEASPLSGRDRVAPDNRVRVTPPPGWGDDGTRVLRLDDPAEPQVWLINTGGTAAYPVDWYLQALDQLLESLKSLTSATGRARPLVAVPFIGAGLGGQVLVRGGLLDELLQHLQSKVSDDADVHFDVVLVLRSQRAFAAAQALRRRQHARYWPAIPHESVVEIESLANHAREGHLVLFLGAGVSVGAGLPTWKQLLGVLAARAGLKDEDLDSGLGGLDRTRLIQRRLEARNIDLRDAIREAIEPVTRYALAHALLADLPSTEAVTTNYDRLFEEAVRGSGQEIAILPYQPVTPGDRWLLKMHGSTDHREDLVLTREDYMRYADRRGALAGIVQALLVTRHMLFVGFSLSDDNFHRIADDVRKAVGDAATEGREPFGTALILNHRSALAELWQDELRCVEIGASEESMPERARILEIFLDRLLASATTAGEHLLDRAFDGMLTDPERTLAVALREFAKRLPQKARETSEWPAVERMLNDLGMRD